MSKQILVNASHYETRVATLENGEIRQLHIEREEDRNVVGNIYKGLVKRVLPGMQAAFLELGLERTAFLYVDDIIEEPFGTDIEYMEDDDGEGSDSDSDDEDLDLDGDDADLDEEVDPGVDEVPAPKAPETDDAKPATEEKDEEEPLPPTTKQEARGPGDEDDRGNRAPRDRGDRPPRSREDRPPREDRGPRDLDRNDRPPRDLDRNDRPPRDLDRNDRPPRNLDREERGPRIPRDDRPPRDLDRNDRPPRGDRPPRAPRPDRMDRPERPPRENRPRLDADVERGHDADDSHFEDRGYDRDRDFDPDRDRGRDVDSDRDRDRYRDRPPRDLDRNDRPPRNLDREERGPRIPRDDRPPRDDRSPRNLDREERGPRIPRDDRPPRDDRGPREDRGERSARPPRSGGRGGRDRGGRSAGRNRRPGGAPRGGRRFPARRPRGSVNIQDVLKEGQEILVQVAKAPIGTKGARLTTHISLPGRNLVLMPTVKHLGISRRIESDRERRRLRDLFVKKIRPKEMGFIIRTVAEGKSLRDLKADADYLIDLWDKVKSDSQTKRAPALIHEDLSLAMRAVRDFFTDEVDTFVIDDPEEYERVQDFITRFMPRLKGRVKLFRGPSQLFEHYGIEAEISRALGKKVWLKSGGYLLIDQSEALTAVDVNTGRYVGSKSLEETILKTNLEAVKEISYQLRVRNVGGIIIIDLIDMESPENREKVFRALQEALNEDKAKTNILKISELGLVEMTRKRTHEDLVRYLTESCGYCEGRGYHKSKRTVCFEIFREIEKEALSNMKNIVVFASSQVVGRMTKEEKVHVKKLEERFNKTIHVKIDPAFHVEQFEVFGKA